MPPTSEHRRELFVALGIAFALILVRFFVYTVYEQSFFDSDQAIVGLMAKHLIEGRAFPLFLYGQPYLLALDAWVAAPFIWIGGLTVPALRASAIFMSFTVVTLLIVGLVRYCRIRPLYALAASVFFCMVGPVIEASLIEPGANTSPFLFVLVLYMLRHRPIWFGATLGVAFLTREFTIYAVPVLLVLDAVNGRLFQLPRLRQWGIAAISAVVVWYGVQALRPLSDPNGPGSRGVTQFDKSQSANLTARMAIIPSELPRRTAAMATTHLPRLLGAKHVDVGFAAQGRDWLFWPVWIALVAGIGRVVWSARGPREDSESSNAGARTRGGGPPSLGEAELRRATPEPSGGEAPRATNKDDSPSRGTPLVWEFPAYLFGVGLVALLAYIATRPAEQSVDRYYLFGLLIPTGLIAGLLTLEARVLWRRVTVAVAIAWTVISATDYVTLAKRYWGGREANEIRVLADALVERHIPVAIAGYWRAYKLTFLTGEKVKVASSDAVRIDEYQTLANQAGDQLVKIQEQPCPNGEKVSRWWLCRK